MKNNQALDEARKYLLYVSDALQAIASSYSTDKEDRTILNKFSSDLFEYSNGLEQLRNQITAKEQAKKKIKIVAELEYAYESQKRHTEKVRTDLRTVKALLKNAEKIGVEADIKEAKNRVVYYTNQFSIAEQNELKAKKEFEQGA